MRTGDHVPFLQAAVGVENAVENAAVDVGQPLRFGIADEAGVEALADDVAVPDGVLGGAVVPDQVEHAPEGGTVAQGDEAVAGDRGAALDEGRAVGEVEQLDQLEPGHRPAVLVEQARGGLGGAAFVEHEAHGWGPPVAFAPVWRKRAPARHAALRPATRVPRP